MAGVESRGVEALAVVMLVRYQGQVAVAGFVGATRYGLSPELAARPEDDVDRRRVVAVCEWALELRRISGREPGRLPGDRPPA
jgi:hypothetical protein